MIADGAGLTIDGEANTITLSGNNAFRVLEVVTGAALTVQYLTIADGHTDNDNGGGILNNTGTLTVTNSTLTGNSAVNGGGIANIGTRNEDGTETLAIVSVTNSTFAGNSATGSAGDNEIEGGGGMFNALAIVSVTNSTFAGNSTGATGSVLAMTSRAVIASDW